MSLLLCVCCPGIKEQEVAVRCYGIWYNTGDKCDPVVNSSPISRLTVLADSADILSELADHITYRSIALASILRPLQPATPVAHTVRYLNRLYSCTS